MGPDAEWDGRFGSAGSTSARSGSNNGGPIRTLGVLGTFVLDRIEGLPGHGEPVEDLGGIAYALSAVWATLPVGWSARPIARVGEDASEPIHGWLGAMHLPTDGLVIVPEPNNRVELRYRDGARRTEHLTGGVGGWSWDELAPVLEGCDALLVNFISGHELALDDLRSLREAFDGPVYADLHSLFLDTAEDGSRVPRPLPEWRAWLACFDAVQMNADELGLLRGATDIETAVDEVLGLGPVIVVCTRGVDGAVCWWAPDAESRFAGGGSGRSPGDGSAVRGEIPAVRVADPDPTGCGDVWGAVMVCRLVAGASVGAAARTATRLAGAAAGWRGVKDLNTRLAEALGDDSRETATSNGGGEP